MLIRMLCIMFALSISLAARSQQISGGPVGCRGDRSEFQRVILSGKILLNKRFLSGDGAEDKRVIASAVELQIKHLMGFFKNSSSDGLNAALSAYRGPLKISEGKLTKYGSDLLVDDYLARGPSANSYVVKAMSAGATKAEDDAELVAYQAELMIADCGAKSFLNHEKIQLPLDPYLSLWLEGKKDRKPRTFGGKTLEGISSCSSSELILFGAADLNWYFWSPLEPKYISPSKTEVCRIEGLSKVYRPEFRALEQLPAATPLTKEFFGSNRKIQVVNFFGIIDKSDAFKAHSIADLKAMILATHEDCKPNGLVPLCLAAWTKVLKPQQGDKYLEPGAFYFILFLKHLYSVAAIESLNLVETDTPQADLIVKYKGRFLDSQMRLEGSVYYGDTTLDHGPPITKSYVKLLHEAFGEADLISYVGHAGVGNNVNIDKLSAFWKRDHLRPIQRTKPMWVGIFNCEGFSYFGFDQNQLFKKGKMKLLLTESSGTESGSKFPLSQLSILNQVYSTKTADAGSSNGSGANKPQGIYVKTEMGLYVQSREFSTEVWLKDPGIQ